MHSNVNLFLLEPFQRYLVTATKTRKTQQAELVKMALQAEEDKKKSEREQFLITTVSIIQQASYEPSLHHAVGDEEADEEVAAPVSAELWELVC